MLKCNKCRTETKLNDFTRATFRWLVSQSDSCLLAARNTVDAADFFTALWLIGFLLVAGLTTSCERNAAPSVSAAPEISKPVNADSFRAKAESGDAQAQSDLGKAYAKGEGVKQSYTEAAKWYLKAAEQGNPSAQNALGELYEAGQGVGKNNYDEAAKWYRRASDQGFASAQYNLAALYVMGNGVPRSNADAAKWYIQAAEGGNKLAQYNVGMRYYEGNILAKDPVEAYKWLTLAAAQGVEDAAKAKTDLKSQMKRQDISEAENRVRNFVVRKTISPGH
jgi:TPR repeat protein